MKNISLTVEFKNPEKELQEQLQRNGARNISIRRNFDGCLEVSYKIVCADPQKEIEKMLSSSGGQSVRSSSSYNGARFDMKIDDRLDEREFKKQIIDALRRAGFRAN